MWAETHPISSVRLGPEITPAEAEQAFDAAKPHAYITQLHVDTILRPVRQVYYDVDICIARVRNSHTDRCK